MSLGQVITSDQLRILHDSFDAFAGDDGYIEPEVIERALRAAGYNPSIAEMTDIYEDIERKPIAFNAFLYISYRHSRNVNVEQELVDAFHVFDTKEVGLLPTKEIKKILKNIKRPFTDDQIDELIKDTNPFNDLVDYKKFVHLMLSNQ